MSVWIVWLSWGNEKTWGRELHSIWLTREEAKATEINWFLNRKDSEFDSYIEEIEIGKENI